MNQIGADGSHSKLDEFDFQPRTRVIFGVNAVERIGELARELGARKILVVTDPGIAQAGHAGRVQQLLEKSGVRVELFTGAKENPTNHSVEQCVAVARGAGVDAIVGLGGGSAMDTAKGCNFLLTNGGKMRDYWGVGKATRPMLPLIAVPTTAGTGSECQSAALIIDEATHQKMACLDPKAAARIALLDPALTLSQPARVTACTGADAIAHAVETAVTTKRSAFSLMHSVEAFKCCIAAFPSVLTNPADLEARGKMLLGAALAGIAIENSMLGAAHAAANPLTAHYGIVHGEAVALMLPGVVRHNSREPEAGKNYELLLRSAPQNGALDSGQRLANLLQSVFAQAQLPMSLSEREVPQKDIPMLAEEAARQWTASFNPIPMVAEDFVKLYEKAWATGVGNAKFQQPTSAK